MNTPRHPLIRGLPLLCCCALMSFAHAHELEPPRTPDTQSADTPAPDAASSVADAPAAQISPANELTPRLRRLHGWRESDGSVVSIGHDSTLAAGEYADAVVAIFGSSDSAGEVRDSVVAVFGDTRAAGNVGDATVAVFGDVYVDGKVNGDVVAVFGNVELGPDAEIGGDVVAIGGVLTRDPRAVIHGNVQRILGGLVGSVHWLRPWIEHCLLYGRPLAFSSSIGWTWGLALGFLALYVLMALLFRDGVERSIHTLEDHPAESMVAALLTALLKPVVFVLLFITVIGIAAVPFLWIALLCAGMFGKVAVLGLLGRRCTPFLAGGPLAHTAISVIIGGLIVLGLYTIPVIGFIVYILLGMLGIGVVVYTLVLATRDARAVRSNPAAAGTSATGSAFVGAVGAAGADASSATDSPPPGPPPPGPPPPSNSPPPSSEGAPAAAAPPLNLLALPRAGFWIRMGALFIDAVLIGFVLGWMHHAFDVRLIGLAAYGAVMWKLKGSTVGGIICGLKVVRLDGREIDWSTAIVRALGCFLSLAVAGLGFIWIAVDADKQSWHDKIAGTVVVSAPPGTSRL